MDAQPLGGDLRVEVGRGVREQRAREHAARGGVVVDEGPDAGRDEPARGRVVAQREVVERGQVAEREHAPGAPQRLDGDTGLAVGLRQPGRRLEHGAQPDGQRQAGVLHLAPRLLDRPGEAARILPVGRAHDHDLVLADDGERPQHASRRARERRRRRAQRVRVVGRGERDGGDQQAARPRLEPRGAGRGQARAGRRLASGEQVLEQVAAYAVALGDELLLSLEVRLGGAGARVVDEVHHRARGAERDLPRLLVVAGELDDRVPDHAVADAERVQEVGERDAAPRPQGGVRADVREVFDGDGPPARQAGAQRVVVLGDVLGDVGEDRGVVDRRVRRDLAADRSQALLGELLAARGEHRGHALHPDQGRGGLHFAPNVPRHRWIPGPNRISASKGG